LLQNVIVDFSTPPLILQIRKKLFELFHKGDSIKLVWIPADIGIQGNEQADKAAKNAVETITITFRPTLTLNVN